MSHEWIIGLFTNVATFVLGYVTSRLVTIREGQRMRDREPRPTTTEGPSRGRTVLTILVVGFLMLAGLGVQQKIYQSDARDYDQCVRKWGSDVIEVLTLRSGAGTDVTKARSARDDAVDQILLVVATSQKVKGEARKEAIKAFRDSLSDFVTAKAALTEALAEQDKTATDNPFPVLHCR